MTAQAGAGAGAAQPKAEAVRRTGRRRWVTSLRTRLLAVVLALVAVICVLIGVATVVSLNGFMTGQLDHQVESAARRAAALPDRAGQVLDAPRGVPAFLMFPGQSPGTLGGTIVDGSLTDAAVVDTTTTTPRYPRVLTVDERRALDAVPRDGELHSARIANLGDYRVAVVPARRANGQPSATDQLIVGMPLSNVQATSVRLATLLSGIGLAALGIAAGVGALLIERALRPLHRVAATAGRVAELPLATGEVALADRVPEADTDPRTEVGQVGSALNRMLDHIGQAFAARHESEQRVRRFVADASHELRTPLAAIQGYAELARRREPELPRDVAYALDRVESQSGRMATLVDDLLLLARLDSGRPLAREPVDLSRLLVEAVDDAHVAGPDHDWALGLPSEPVTVIGDAQRLHQVVANLLTNARTHTPPGTRVDVRLTRVDSERSDRTGGRVRVEVSDDGPGIPPALVASVFERFARGDSSRSRAAGSTGLGLSIVAAVVEAHRGSVTVASHPGRTTFTVTLPASVPTPAESTQPPHRQISANAQVDNSSLKGPAGTLGS